MAGIHPPKLYVFGIVSVLALISNPVLAATDGSRFDPADFAPLGALNLTSGSVTFTTTTGAVTGFSNGTLTTTEGGRPVAVYCFDSISVSGGATISVSGTRGLVLLSRGDIVLGANLLANAPNASGTSGGLGVISGSNGGNANVAGSGPGGGGRQNNEGGAGAGYGGLGGRGASNNTIYGAVYGQDGLIDIYGGSGGGGGGSSTNSGSGAGGGGAIALCAAGSITINSGYTISANGGVGSYATRFGGGGGSGGSILLSAPTVTNNGTLSARGGNGGGATQNSREGGGGGAGGRIAIYANVSTAGVRDVSGGAGGPAPGGTPGWAGAGGTTFSDDFSDPPSVLSITRLDASPTNAATVRFRVAFSAPVNNVQLTDFSLTTTGISGASIDSFSASGTSTYDVVVLTGNGDGSLSLNVLDFDTITDVGGVPLGGVGVGNGGFTTGETYGFDNVAPTIAISDPTPSITRTGPVTFTVTYTGASAVNLPLSSVHLHATDSATGTLSVSGTGTGTRTITVSSISGNGTLAVSVDSGSATDVVGNTDSGAGPSASFEVDNIAPTISISEPSSTVTVSGPVTYTVTYSGASAVTLAAGHVTLNRTGTANGTVTVTGSGTATRTVQISSITGMGTISIAIAAGTASDAAGNTAPAAGPSTPFDVTSTGVSVSIGAPSVSLTRTGPVEFEVSYTGATDVTLGPGDVTLNTGTGTVTGSVNVTGGGNKKRTVTISGITGDGPLGISIAAGTATNGPLTAPAAGPSATCTVDNTPPTFTVTPPDGLQTCGTENIKWQLSFTDASPCVLNDSMIHIELTGSLTGTFSVVAASDVTRHVFVKNVLGIGSAVLTIEEGAAVDDAGNESVAWGPSEAVFANGDPPPIAVGPPSLTETNTGPVEYTISYENATAVTLSASDVVLNSTGDATGQVSVSGSGLETRTVTISNISGDGTLGISINAGTASDTCAQLSAAAGPSGTFLVDNTPPAIAISPPSVAVTNDGPVTYTITYTDAAAVTLVNADISLETTGTANASVAVSGGGMTTRTVTLSNISGDGTIAIRVAPGTASDALGNLSVAAGPSTPFTVDNTPPAVAIGAPSATLTRTGPISYTVTFTDADSVLLAPGLVTLNKTGTANGTVNVLGSTLVERTVEITGISGTGTLGISIAAGSATDQAGNSAGPAGPSATFQVDNTPPSISIGGPSGSPTRSGPVSYTVTYSGASSITLAATDLLLTTTGDASADVAVTGSGNMTRTVTFTNAAGDGEISFSIQPGTAVDLAGNTAGAGGPSAAFVVDNTPPSVALGVPSPVLTSSGPVTSVVTYTGASNITLSTANVTLHRTGTANATAIVGGTGSTQRTVTFTGATGDGTIAYSIAAGTGTDAAGNAAGAGGPSGTFTVDNTPPGISIGAPSSAMTSRGPVTYTVTYTDAETISLSAANVSVVRTGTANGVVAVSGVGAERYVTVQDIIGNGSIAINIGAGTAQDLAGNPAPAAGPSASFNVNNEAISVSIGPPSVGVTTHGPVTYPITYDNALSVNLTNDDVTVNTTGTAAGTATVSGSGLTDRVVTIDSISGDGAISITIDSGTGLDDIGQPAPGAGPGAPFTVDNTPPAVSIGNPSAALTQNGPVVFQVTYTGASSITLQSADVVLASKAAVTADIEVTGAGPTRTITLANIAGDGVVGISLAAGTASDAAGNVAPGIASGSFTVDNTAPVVTVSGATPGLTKSGPAAWTVDFGDASSISLSPVHITLTRTGTADGVAVVTGMGSSQRTVTLYNATGDGTIAFSIAAAAARDGAGNFTTAVAPSPAVRIDNTPPALSMLGESPLEIEYTLPYMDAGATAVDNVDGVITERIAVANYVDTGVPGAYTVSYSVTDTVGNAAPTAVRTVQVVRTTTEKIIMELLGGTLCRPGICVTINPNRVFTPAGVIPLVIDRPNMQLFPTDMMDSVVAGTWFDLKPNHLSAVDMGYIRLYYDDQDQDGLLDGTERDENDLFVYFINPVTGEVLTLEGTVEWIDNYVQMPISRFGVYSLGCPVKSDEIPFDPDGELPVSSLVSQVMVVLLLAFAGMLYVRRGRRQGIGIKH